jgi:RimJ/RimL family protein N-acetyltransferase
LSINIIKLTIITPEIAASFNNWENDPALIPFIRPNQSQADLDKREAVTTETLQQRLEHDEIYLIYEGERLIGEMNYQVDPKHLFKKETGTAWIGINIGEESARGKGIGTVAMQFLEQQIRIERFKRIELGVFEFNTNAIELYQKLGYQEIGRIKDFTYWKGKLWQDIRMEKYLE